MLRQWIARRVRSAPRALQHPLQGALAAMCLATLCQQVAILLGTSLPVLVAMVLAVALGCWAGPSRWLTIRPLSTHKAAPLIVPAALTFWMIASPWGLDALEGMLSRVVAASTGPWNTACVLGGCLFLVTIPTAWCVRLGWRAAADSSTGNPARVLCGATVGLTVWTFGGAQWLGPWTCGVLAAGLCLATTAWRIWKNDDATRVSFAGGDVRPEIHSKSTGLLPSSAFALLLDVLLAIGCGGLFAAASQVVDQLLPATLYSTSAQIIGVLAGLSLGCASGSWRWLGGKHPRQRAAVACGGLALHCLLLLAAFPTLVHWSLWLNAWVSSTALLLAGRGLIAGCALFPIGLIAAWCLRADTVSDARESWDGVRTRTTVWLFGAAVGFCLTIPASEFGFASDVVLIALAWGISIAAIARHVRWETIPQGFAGRGAWVGLAALVACAPLCRGNYDPRLASRLLFNTNVFLAYRAGYDSRLLPCLDEARHVGTIAGARGTTTVWKFGGAQLQIRENGIPTGVISCDPQVFPRYVAETLPAAWPMILHQKPQSLLILGAGTGEALAAALEFPLPEISCWEADASHVRLIREVVAAHCGVDLLGDDRVRLTVADPALALEAEQETFDVVVSAPGHLALLRAQPYLTQSFYRRAARRLAPQGVFCQRIQMIDLGPRPLQAVVRTLQSVFTDVMALEISPGELLLTATNNPQGLLQPKLTDRLQLPHVQHLLGQSGVDWSVLLNLTALRNEELAQFAGAVGANGAGNSRLAFSLPREVMRWGPKYDEVHAELAPLAGRIVAWIGDEGTSPVLVRRLSEVTGGHELMSKYSDQYWSYRATLRTQLSKKPRSQVEPVSFSSDRGQMHPEDRRRRDYFVALGRAIKSKNLFDVVRLEKFEFPFDPLLSYFLHQEVAELYAKASERDVAQELRHRLHAVWFSSPRDASLQNVLATLQLLREFPDAEPDPLRRWDTMNALLQALQQRWEARTGVTPTDVKATLNEIDATVLAAEKTLNRLDELTVSLDLPAEMWEARRLAVERNLIRPVRSYRSDLLPHLHKKKSAQAERAEEGGERPADSAEDET